MVAPSDRCGPPTSQRPRSRVETMKATGILSTLLVLTALGPLAGAPTPPAKSGGQTPPAKSGQTPPAEKPAPKKEPPKQEPTHAAEATAKEPGREISFTVTGLTKDNVAKVKESLQGLATHAYQCEPCKFEQATAGNCPKCQGALAPVTHNVFQTVTPSADAGTVMVKIDPSATLRLSELDSTLSKNSVKIDPDHFPLPGRARLVVKGATADMAPAIEK